jgi:adenylylsulfate kinase-like enzyme
MIVWFTGQPGSGKTTIAERLQLEHDDWQLVDGDDLRELLPNPGYDRAGRERNIDRAQAIAAWLDMSGLTVLVALVAPYRAQREAFKRLHNALEVYLHTDEVRGREHYHVEDYEPPLVDYVDIDTGKVSIDDAVRIVYRAMAALS